MSLWICPICGKQNSIRHYDPTNFVKDILIILKRGLGKGKSFEEVDRYSLLDGSDPELLDLISDRVAVIYDLLHEERSEEREDLIDDINAVLDPYIDEGFDNLLDAADALLDQFLEYDEEEVPEHTVEGALVVVEEEDADDYESLTELEKELRRGEKEGEDINDIEEEIID